MIAVRNLDDGPMLADFLQRHNGSGTDAVGMLGEPGSVRSRVECQAAACHNPAPYGARLAVAVTPRCASAMLPKFMQIMPFCLSTPKKKLCSIEWLNSNLPEVGLCELPNAFWWWWHMKDVQRIAIVDPSDATREPLRNLLLGVESVWLEAECSRYEFFIDVARQSCPDAVVIALDADQTKALQLIQQLTVEFPHMPILAVSSRGDGQSILQALRAGAKEFLTAPVVLEELLLALQRLRANRASGRHQRHP